MSMIWVILVCDAPGHLAHRITICNKLTNQAHVIPSRHCPTAHDNDAFDLPEINIQIKYSLSPLE